jgi:nitrogen fixation NifU-like protein
MQDLTDLYQSVILDHNRRPRNYKVLPAANRVGSGNNPLCGDEVTVYVELEGDRIKDIGFQGSGCAISQASTSLMTLNLKGKTIKEAEALAGDVHKFITTGQVPDDSMSDLAALAGVHQFPARIKCATLGWHSALNAIHGVPKPVTTEKPSD